MCNHNDSLMLYIHSTDWSLGRKGEKKKIIKVLMWMHDTQTQREESMTKQKRSRRKAEGK